MAANRLKARFQTFGIRHSIRGLALLLLSGMGPEALSVRFRQRRGFTLGGDLYAKESVPYLPAIGPPGLLFCKPEPAAAPAIRPVAVGPPVPGLNVVENAGAAANSAASLAPLQDSVLKAEPAKATVVAPPSEPMPSASAKPAAPPIMRDDVKPQVRPEDFLPYFQVPANPVPPSAASYTQTLK